MPSIPNELVNVLDQLLADLFDENKSRIELMGSDYVDSSMLPDELEFQKSLLDAFNLAADKDIPPTVNNIKLLCKYRGLDKDTLIEQIEIKKSEQPLIRSSAIYVRGWASQALLHKTVNDISRIDGLDMASIQEKQSMMIDKLLAMPFVDKTQVFSRLDIIESLYVKQRERVLAAENNQVSGGILHLHGLRQNIPVLEDGDVTLITAPPKSGKTTTAMIIAELNAIENDVDVLWLLAETSPRTIEERFEARDLLIPGWALRSGRVNFDKEPFKTKHNNYLEIQRDYWAKYGHINLQYIAGASLSDIAALIRVHKRLADSRNRPLVVIIDYLQRLAKPRGKTDVEALADLSNGIKDIAVRNDCHIILFSQESFTIAAGDSRAHGSNTPIFIAQLHMAIKVLNTAIDVQITNEDGNPMYNAIGGERYWQRVGKNKRQSVVKYEVLRANDNETTSAFAAFESDLFLMLDCSDPTVGLPLFISTDIANFERYQSDPNRKLI